MLRSCGRAHLTRALLQAAPMVDAVVFSKVRARLGGRVRLVCSGSAPLAHHVEEFLKVVMCAPVSQGYGLTETCGSSFIALPETVRAPTLNQKNDLP